MTETPSGLRFVLVHGASHGAWCWYKVRCLLERAGYRVSCLDLAGAGIHPSDPNTILTFDAYNKPLIDFMGALPEDEMVILVGHSLGGLNVTDALNKFTSKVHLAVYVNAAMLPTKAQPTAQRYKEMFDFWYGLGPDKPATSTLMKKELQCKVMYNISPKEDSTLAAMLLRPCPSMAAGKASLRVGDGVDKVKRIYIRGTSDVFMSDENFKTQISIWPPSEVLMIEGDHSPFFSAPNELFRLLVNATDALFRDSEDNTGSSSMINTRA